MISAICLQALCQLHAGYSSISLCTLDLVLSIGHFQHPKQCCGTIWRKKSEQHLWDCHIIGRRDECSFCWVWSLFFINNLLNQSIHHICLRKADTGIQALAIASLKHRQDQQFSPCHWSTIFDSALLYCQDWNNWFWLFQWLKSFFFLSEVLRRLTSGAASYTSTTTQMTSSSASPLSFTVKGKQLPFL